MKVTVCDFTDNENEFADNWVALKEYVHHHQPELLLMPEMPFCNWVAASKEISKQLKDNSVDMHDLWLEKLGELKVKYVVYSRPVLAGEKYHNTAFVYEMGKGHREIHTKHYFPEEPHFWEESWFDSAEKGFEVMELDGFKIGVLLCTEMWFTEHARAYGKQGIDLLLCPRATDADSVAQWMRCGQTLAVVSGAYCLSANKSGYGNQFLWGGTGWIAAPINGELLATTVNTGFATIDVDLRKSAEAKDDYPLYVKGDKK